MGMEKHDLAKAKALVLGWKKTTGYTGSEFWISGLSFGIFGEFLTFWVFQKRLFFGHINLNPTGYIESNFQNLPKISAKNQGPVFFGLIFVDRSKSMGRRASKRSSLLCPSRHGFSTSDTENRPIRFGGFPGEILWFSWLRTSLRVIMAHCFRAHSLWM